MSSDSSVDQAAEPRGDSDLGALFAARDALDVQLAQLKREGVLAVYQVLDSYGLGLEDVLTDQSRPLNSIEWPPRRTGPRRPRVKILSTLPTLLKQHRILAQQIYDARLARRQELLEADWAVEKLLREQRSAAQSARESNAALTNVKRFAPAKWQEAIWEATALEQARKAQAEVTLAAERVAKAKADRTAADQAATRAAVLRVAQCLRLDHRLKAWEVEGQPFSLRRTARPRQLRHGFRSPLHQQMFRAGASLAQIHEMRLNCIHIIRQLIEDYSLAVEEVMQLPAPSTKV